MGVIEKQSIQDIADAIRDRNGLTTLYKPRQMDEAIRGLYKTEAVNHIFDNLTISTTTQGSNITITDADTTKQAEITEIKGAGEKRKLPIEYQEVEYIEATGTQWINTLYSMLEQNVWKLETKVNLTANSLAIMGYALETDSSNEVWTDGQGYIIARFLPEVNRVVIKQLSINTDYTITFDNNSSNFVVTINDETFTYNRIEPRQRTNAPIGFGHRQGGAYLKGKIYSLKIWSDTLERNFIPCYRVIDNVVGMYDTVTNTFYENAGTDAFGKGADIIYNNVTGDNKIVSQNKNILVASGDTSFMSGITVTKNNASNIIINGSGTGGVGGKAFAINGNGGANYTTYITRANVEVKTLKAGTYAFSIHNIAGETTATEVNFDVIKMSSSTPHQQIARIRYGQSNSVVFTVTEEGDYYFAVGFAYSNSAVSFTNFSFDVQLEKNTQATSFLAHEGTTYRVDLDGKNIFNTEQAITRMENAGGTLINDWGTYEDGILTMNRSMGYYGACYFAGQKFNLKANKSYTLSATVYLTGTNTTSNVILGFEGASNPNVTITKEVWTKVSKTVSFTKDKENVRVFIQPSNTGNVLQMKEIMLCEGTDTEYSPYTANPIELSENDKLWNNNGTWQLNDTAITDNYLLEQLQALENIELYEDLCYVDWIGIEKPTMNLRYYVDTDKILEKLREE